jgi:DNA (cytosine-5)-methyltransferase 1
MTNLKHVPIDASQIKTHAGKLKFSTLLESFRLLPADRLADIFHFLQNRESNARQIFLNRVKSFLPTETFRFIKDKEVIWDVPFPPVTDPKFTFIDLFAGIGGMRIAFQKLNGQCVFSSEWDDQAKTTYSTNFGEVPYGDITKIDENEIPKHNILVAGFPCQAFSIAGFKSGFEDTRGTLFFDVARIIKSRKPDAFLLENVKGLVGHDKGKTLEIILRTLRDDLGYFVPEPRVMNARDFGVPQHRERIFIVGFKSKAAFNRFSYPKPLKVRKVIADIKEKDVVPVKYYLSTQYLSTLKAHRKRHSDKGNGFGYEVLSDDAIANAIVVGGMGRERNLLIDDRLKEFTPTTNIKGPVNREGIRKMTPREWARLQGFPDRFEIPVSDAQAYKQFGNSVAVPAVHATAKSLIAALLDT